MLEARGLTKRYGDLVALNGLDLTVGDGEIVGVIGPNGAGKTTLVNVIGGAAPGWRGSLAFEGRSLRRLRPHTVGRLGIARTFQVAQPFAGLTVLENALVGARFGGRAGVEQAEEALAAVGLAERADDDAEMLSAPERKRLEIAKAIAMHPRLLLLDEVMAGLTAAEVALAVDVIKRVHDRGVSILLIEHVMQVITSLADRVVVLHHGEKLVEGPPEQVLADEGVIRAYLGSRRA